MNKVIFINNIMEKLIKLNKTSLIAELFLHTLLSEIFEQITKSSSLFNHNEILSDPMGTSWWHHVGEKNKETVRNRDLDTWEKKPQKLPTQVCSQESKWSCCTNERRQLWASGQSNFPTFSKLVAHSCTQTHIKRPTQTLNEIALANYTTVDGGISLNLNPKCSLAPASHMKHIFKTCRTIITEEGLGALVQYWQPLHRDTFQWSTHTDIFNCQSYSGSI